MFNIWFGLFAGFNDAIELNLTFFMPFGYQEVILCYFKLQLRNSWLKTLFMVSIVVMVGDATFLDLIDHFECLVPGCPL